MTITHVALWTHDLEAIKAFYTRYLGGVCDETYRNPATDFSSCFIRFEAGTRLELMHRPDITSPPVPEERAGFGHIAFALGSEEAVRSLTETLRHGGFHIAGEPRTTGDGYFESVILDPEANRVELTV